MSKMIILSEIQAYKSLNNALFKPEEFFNKSYLDSLIYLYDSSKGDLFYLKGRIGKQYSVVKTKRLWL